MSDILMSEQSERKSWLLIKSNKEECLHRSYKKMKRLFVCGKVRRGSVKIKDEE